MQHACRIANATAIECHIDHLVLYMMRLAWIGIIEEKGTAFARLLTAAVALLALGTGTMSDNIDPITVWTVEHKCNHSSLGKSRWSFSCPEGTRSTAVQHLPTSGSQHDRQPGGGTPGTDRGGWL